MDKADVTIDRYTQSHVIKPAPPKMIKPLDWMDTKERWFDLYHRKQFAKSSYATTYHTANGGASGEAE